MKKSFVRFCFVFYFILRGVEAGERARNSQGIGALGIAMENWTLEIVANYFDKPYFGCKDLGELVVAVVDKIGHFDADCVARYKDTNLANYLDSGLGESAIDCTKNIARSCVDHFDSDLSNFDSDFSSFYFERSSLPSFGSVCAYFGFSSPDFFHCSKDDSISSWVLRLG